MLLKTRFYLPPLRKQSVYRKRLIQRLNQAQGGELIIVAAPPGYGKSTLVSQWLHFHPHTFAWLTLDQSHNSPNQFWHYVLNALQNIQPTVGVEVTRQIQQGQNMTMTNIVISLLNDLDRCSLNTDSDDAMTLVLDDFHLLENTRLIEMINLFLDHTPPNLRLVITSREDPPLALARRRANNQLVELGTHELAFSLDEAVQFFRHSMALTVDTSTVSTFQQSTEGWIAGLQLAALSLKNGAVPIQTPQEPIRLNHHIEDYLFDEVFAQQNDEIQSFLIQTAALPRFCAGLANTITGRNDSQKRLLTLEQANLFLVALDNHRTWYRYHDMFRQLLLKRFQQLNPETQLSCHQRAAEWLEQWDYLDDAIDQRLAAKQWQLAATLIKDYIATSDYALEPAQYKRWLSCFPASEVEWLKNLPPAAPTVIHDASTPHRTTHSLIVGAEPLTQREQQVLGLIANGLPNKDIAEHLHISVNTLKVHIRNLYSKMGVENRTQALVKIK